MRFHSDQFIHDLPVNTILSVLNTGAWRAEQQTITSAITNDNPLTEPELHWLTLGENTSGINAFIDIQFDPNVKRILDVGGGQFDCNRDYLKRTRNLDLLIWDPYNRTAAHNLFIQKNVMARRVDAATSMSVLNVIPDVLVRLAHIVTVKNALQEGGQAYFKIWAGDQMLQGSYLPSATAHAFQANAHADRFLREIELVFGIGNARLDATVANLIVATKVAQPILQCDIVSLQQTSKKEALGLTLLKKQSMNRLFFSSPAQKIFAREQTFFNRLQDVFIEQNRHKDAIIQQEYDSRFGLIKQSS